MIDLVFEQSYTQYIPLPISDLDSWLKTPSIYVFDCSAARMILNAFVEVKEITSSLMLPILLSSLRLDSAAGVP